MPTEPGPTEVITGSETNTVNSAQMSAQSPTTVPPVASPSDPEERIRRIMSERDRTQNEYNKQVAERLKLEQQLATEKTERERITNAAAQNTQQILDQKRQVEQELEHHKAETLKLSKLVQYPELRDYAALLPQTTDEAVLNNAIASLLTARERDIEAAKQATLATMQTHAPVAPAQQNPPLYPQNQFTPPIAPARPAPTASTADYDPFQVQLDLRAKMKEAYEKNDMSIYYKAEEEAAKRAQALMQGR